MLYRIEGLRRVRGASTILDIESLEIEPEKVYTLVGPNGAGKTTLLHILSFLDAPTEGRLYFSDERVQFSERRLRDLRRHVTLVEQYPILFSGSVRANVEYGLKLRRLPKEKRGFIVEEVLEMVGMGAFIDADARKLSGGENKRVALARALALEPRVLLCDEPTANVDSENQEIILTILERCNREKKVSLIFATHYLSQASRLADNMIVLQNGRLSGAGRENLFSARFLEIREEERIFQIGHGIEIAAPEELPLDNAHYTTQFRPNRITLLYGGEAGRGPNRCSGTVEKIGKRGGNVCLTVDCGVRFKVEQSLEEYRKNPVRLEDRVTLLLPVDRETFLCP